MPTIKVTDKGKEYTYTNTEITIALISMWVLGFATALGVANHW